jgi:nitroreductase
MSERDVFKAIATRHAVRKFSSREIPDTIMQELLELAHLAPSGYNLQPWHFIVVKDARVKKALRYVSLNQAHVENAAAVVIFAANPSAWKDWYREILETGRKAGAYDDARVRRYLNLVRLTFSTAPFGLFGFAKRIAIPIMRLKKPIGKVLYGESDKESYVARHTMLAAATFMIAARGHGLATCPMEGFDEYRLKRLLHIPMHWTVPIIVAAGYELEGAELQPRVRRPISQVISLNFFGSRDSRKGPKQKA